VLEPGEDVRAKNVTVKMKYSDFSQATRSKTTALPFSSCNDIQEAAVALLATVYPFRRSVRLLGVTLSTLTTGTIYYTQQSQLGFDW
jgi:DNA polymerase-4